MQRHGTKATINLGAGGWELTWLAFCMYLYVQCNKRGASKISVYLM